MCSITGIWNLDGATLRSESLRKFSAALKHRGPDGTGIHIDETACIGLGNNRLAIVDRRPQGDQPMSYGRSRYWLTFNGEIYNFPEVRAELEAHGYTFSTDTDAEVVVAAYACWGTGSLHKLDGMWAFAIWDSWERRLFLSRDRFGVKPLYYTFDGHRFAFASEVKAFLALDGFAPSIDLAYQATSIATREYLFAGPSTLLQDVRRLEAGHCLSLSVGHQPVLTRWWCTLDHIYKVPRRFEDQVEAFRDVLEDACRMRIRTSLPIGISLSGGMDSTSILATADKVLRAGPTYTDARPDGGGLKAYVATYNDVVRDESVRAKVLTDRLGIDTRFVKMDSLITEDALDRMLFQTEDIHSVHPSNWMIYEAMQQDGTRIALTGDGGDELFVGYQPQIDAAIADSLSSPFQIFRYFALNSLKAQTLAADPAVLNADWPESPGPQVVGSELLSVDARVGGSSTVDADLARLSGNRKLAKCLYRDFHGGILPWILHLKDLISMAHGVEIRSPMLDWRVVCFAFGLPGTSLVDGVATKRILREAMAGRLPDPIRKSKTKISFVNHEGSAFWQSRSLVLETVYSEVFLASPLWPGRRLQQLAECAYRDHDHRLTEFLWRCVKASRLQSAFRNKDSVDI